MKSHSEFAALTVPVFFPSISSVKDHHPFAAYFTLLAALGAPAALTSAYDWYHLDSERKGAALDPIPIT